MRDTARQAWMLLEPIHAVTYFSPEPLAALREAGYRGFWMGYFAGRAAPLGPASAELVHALFYNFTPSHVGKALPDAWSFAPPAAALGARLDGSVAALRRLLGDADGIERAADLALKAASHAPAEGRALFAANRSLAVPTDPLARLWHAATLLREHRGDGHVAVLVAAGISGREAHVLHALTSGTPAEVYAVARGLGEAEWSALCEDLSLRGLVADGQVTELGRDVKAVVEEQTDRLAATAYAGLTAAEMAELLDLLRPLARAVVAGGDLPAKSPMGLDLDEVLGE
ncbi:hypothetical protein GCM10011584_09810 [Nocardioides phosphati]|uniref:MarR family transcriptional regulator n=1 Tax=Nocardioides phosphati TaxID=1867775 RepID=A0ABQ2N6W4_9ACTN|nr:hypothetical protein [Nocardioides phosphati]GGO86775.1 hypothetical protein GCM10011584_09810 [Nocardioides phosphati]